MVVDDVQRGRREFWVRKVGGAVAVVGREEQAEMGKRNQGKGRSHRGSREDTGQPSWVRLKKAGGSCWQTCASTYCRYMQTSHRELRG